jgi:hypothetical protein
VLPEFGNGAGHLHAGRPSAYHHHRKQTFPAGTGFLGQGFFHVFEQHAADVHGLGQRFERHAVLGHARDVVVVRSGPGGNHQVVVGQFAAGGLHGIRRGFHGRHLGEAEKQVGVLVEDFAERRHHRIGFQGRGGYLVQQRGKRIVVAFVEQHHLVGGIAQGFSQRYPPEAAPTMTTRGNAVAGMFMDVFIGMVLWFDELEQWNGISTDKQDKTKSCK